MSGTIETTLAMQLSVLAQRVQAANQEGDPDGLMARHFFDHPNSKTFWRVSCSNVRWMEENAQSLQQANFGKLAALGYSLSFGDSEERGSFSDAFVEGCKRLQRRELFPQDQVAFPNIPSAFLGIVLGTLALSESKDKADLMAWLKRALGEALRRKTLNGFTKLVYEYIGTLLGQKILMVAVPDARCGISELALVDWARRRGIFQLPDPERSTPAFQERILTMACSVDLTELSPGEAAIVSEAVSSCLSSSIHDRVLSPSHVVQLLGRFECAMRRWRWDDDDQGKPVRWPVTDEREVQDVAWLVLRSVFDDVVDEDTLPKLGHSSYRPDFGIASIGTLIEVKFARRRADFKRIEKEVMEDAVAYLQATRLYKRLVVFIYDDSASVQEHQITKAALEKMPNVEGVVIVSRPSQLPPTGKH